LYDTQLYKLRLNSVLYQCLPPNEAFRLLVNLHGGSIRRYFGSNDVVKKVLAFGYWWPILFKYIVEMCQNVMYANIWGQCGKMVKVHLD
jgi:hypothetical protein